MGGDISTVDSLLKAGLSPKEVKEIAAYFQLTFEAIADDVIARCKSGRLAFNLDTIQGIIKHRAHSSAGSLPRDKMFYYLVNKDPVFFRMVARRVKQGIEDGSLRKKSGTFMPRITKSLADILDPVYEKIDDARTKLSNARSEKKTARAAIKKANAEIKEGEELLEKAKGPLGRVMQKLVKGAAKFGKQIIKRAH